MQKGKVLDFKKIGKYLQFLKTNKCLIIVTFCFVFGIWLGVFLYKNNLNFSEFSQIYRDSFLKIHKCGKFLPIFLNSLFSSFIFLLSVFVLGTSVVGVTTVPIIIILRGALFGCLSSVIYSSYALKGITLNTVIIIPSTLISVISLIFAAKEALNFSLLIAKVTLPSSPPKNLSLAFRFYFKRFLIILFPTISSAVVDSWISTKLFNFFEF